MLYDQHYRVLLLQRQDDPTFWQSVTGALEEGELPLETAYREAVSYTHLDVYKRQQLHCGYRSDGRTSS
ncbi:Dihydroneopterin triphosphate pyrophosphohydrolase type 2 [Geitlerinema sp. FC II]|nr:Dihydroneopterin triphosphate pyrophosphohydrolase type 2 [Geitlerinema sp. FC II]